MKLLRFGEAGQERPGVLDPNGVIRDVSDLVSDWAGHFLDPDSLAQFSLTDLSQCPVVSPATRLGPPVPAPGKIICIGLNYSNHAVETGFATPDEPLVFLKSPTSICGPTDPISIPKTARAVDWEVELAFVIGRRTVGASLETAMAAVSGFAVANDVTERDWQFRRGGQWSKAKSADTFGPLGPWLVTKDEIASLANARIWLQKNNEIRQDAKLGQMTFSIPEIIVHLSEFMRLMPGDVVLTGTPAGVAFNKTSPDYLARGDVIRCGIDGLGEQRTLVE